MKSACIREMNSTLFFSAVCGAKIAGSANKHQELLSINADVGREFEPYA